MKHTLLILFVLLLAAPAFAQSAPTANPSECVSSYDASLDYFPEKTTVEFASGFTLEYAANYKIITVSNPWPGAADTDQFRYVLVQCGTPAPTDIEDALVIEIPTQRVIAMSTTFLPHFAQLGLLDSLAGVDSLLYVNSPEVIAKGEAGELVEVGFGAQVSVEVALDAEPDLVLSYGSGSPEFDAHPVLLEAGIPVALSSDWMETTPLGRAEWIKFTAAFFNREAAADEVFAAEVEAYSTLTALTAAIDAETRPTVLWGSYFGDSWAIPGGQSYIAALLNDAGAQLILSDSPEAADQAGSALFDFESVFEAGADADYWMPLAFGVTDLASFVAGDARYADFAAAANGQVWNNDARVNANGGNDYYESGVTNPSGVLADLIAILYPDLLPDHTFIYFRNLSA